MAHRILTVLLGSFLVLIAEDSAIAGEVKSRIPVVISSDTGCEIDDQWAIVYALMSSEIEVLGLMSAHAPSFPPPAAHTSYLVQRAIVEERLGLDRHPPIVEGAGLPLKDTNTPQPSQAASFLVAVSKPFSSENRLNVLTIGAATDVASAILLDPAIVSRIRVVQMGFNDWPEGGDVYNVLNDIKAAQVIFAADVPIVVGSARVCTQHLSLGFDQARQMVSGHGPVGRWLWDEYAAHYYRYVKPLRVEDFSKSWIIWDAITVAYLLGFTDSERYGKPKVRDDMSFDHVKTRNLVTWIKDVDEQRMWADFLRKLDSYQQTHAVGSYRFRSRLTFLVP